MFYGICALLISLMLILVMLSYFTPARPLRGSALHPYNLLGFFIVIVVCDFFFAHRSVLNGDAVVFARQSILVEEELVRGAAFFAFCVIAGVLGIGLATFQGTRHGPPPAWAAELGPPPRPPHGAAAPPPMPAGRTHGGPPIPGAPIPGGFPRRGFNPLRLLPAGLLGRRFGPAGYPPHPGPYPAAPHAPLPVPPINPMPAAELAIRRRAATYTLVLCGLLGLFVTSQVVLTSLDRGNLFHVAAIRQTFFRANPVLIVLYSLLVPSLILFGSYRQRIRAPLILLALAVMMLLFPLGGRGALVVVVITLGFWFAASGFRVHWLAVYLAAPFIGFALLVLRYYGRETDRFASLESFVNESGGALNVFFNTTEISLAESLTVNLTNAIVERSPFDTILGAAFAFVPRAIIPWKPFGASAEFTMTADLARWELVKSEWTVTGFVNLYYDFGYLGAVALTGVLAYLWARLFCRSAAKGGQSLLFWGPVGINMVYIFFRGDLYNLALFLWPLAVVLCFHWGFTKVIALRILPGAMRPLGLFGR